MTGREKNVTIIEVVGQDKPVSDLYAKQIAKDIISADEAETKARRTLYNRVMKAVPPKKAVRYLQLEGKIRAVQAYEIAETIPLIKYVRKAACRDRAGMERKTLHSLWSGSVEEERLEGTNGWSAFFCFFRGPH